ncbi:MAG: sugar transferase [Bacteroidales bacterium]|nr:sugar transferase [Bacteroidales bacterium]
MYISFFKRFIDLTITFILIFVFIPLFIIVVILIKSTSNGPVFFKQQRAGKHGRPFMLLKFRTMYDRPRDVDHEIFKGDPEVTWIGHVLRRLKIDELPQLANVLIGDMSIVGPRPGMESHIKDFNEDGVFRIHVKPGLTGLAQVNGNIYLSWPQRWKLDRYYVENLSFSLDIKIIFKTFSIIILGEEKFLINKQ